MAGDKEYHEFTKLVCPSLSESDISEIARHMDRFDDWPESYLLDSIINYLNLTDEQFMFLLEQYVNPNIHHWKWNEEDDFGLFLDLMAYLIVDEENAGQYYPDLHTAIRFFEENEDLQRFKSQQTILIYNKRS